MAPPYLVPPPSPTPTSYVKETKFTVHSADGTADVFVYGLAPGATDAEYRLGNAFMGTTGYDRTTSQISGGAPSSLTKFAMTGLCDGDSVALFRQQNFGTTIPDLNWVKISGAMPVKVSGDQFTSLLAQHKLASYAPNSKIKFYPFGALERNPPVKEVDWVNSVTAALDAIGADAVGQAMLKLLSTTVVIRPWVPNTLGAFSDKQAGVWYIDFSPQVCTGGCASSPAEVLLHELIHVLENNKDGYRDLAGFVFDVHDFMSVNVVNVFSKNAGRALRKDHFRPSPSVTPPVMPPPWDFNPWQHSVDLKDDYAIAKKSHPHIFAAVAGAMGAWNPFWYYSKTYP